MMLWGKSSMSSKKAMAMALSKLVSYIIVIFVFVILGAVVFQQPLKELIVDFADERLEMLQNEPRGSQESLSAAVKSNNEFDSLMVSFLDSVNNYDEQDDCIIQLSDPLPFKYKFEDSKNKDVSSYIIKNDDAFELYTYRLSSNQKTRIGEFENIDNIYHIRDADAYLFSNKDYGLLIRELKEGFSNKEFNSYLSLARLKINNLVFGDDILIEHDGKKGSYSEMILYGEGVLSFPNGGDDLTENRYIFKVQNSLFIYNGDAGNGIDLGIVNSDPSLITFHPSFSCEVKKNG